MLKEFKNDELLFECTICGKDLIYKMPPNYEPKFLVEFGHYENIQFTCPNCEAEGRNITHVINLNIPEIEEMELEVMELEAPPEEVHSRNVVRNIMWSKRPDLKNKNRQRERQNFINANAAAIEQQRKQINAMRATGRGNNNATT